MFRQFKEKNKNLLRLKLKSTLKIATHIFKKLEMENKKTER
jgi:hypothetical protein